MNRFIDIYKIFSLLILWSVFISTMDAQGLDFYQGSYSDVLTMAEKEDLPIFIFVHTDWCPGCKKMEKEVFPSSEIGAIYNQNFIAFKINPEKSEHAHLSEKWNIRVFPTLIFLNKDEDLIYKLQGYKTTSELMATSSLIYDFATYLKEDPNSLSLDELQELLLNTQELNSRQKNPFFTAFLFKIKDLETIEPLYISILETAIPYADTDILTFLIDYHTNSKRSDLNNETALALDTRLRNSSLEAAYNLARAEIDTFSYLRKKLNTHFPLKHDDPSVLEINYLEDLILFHDLSNNPIAFSKTVKILMSDFITKKRIRAINKKDGFLNYDITPNNPRKRAHAASQLMERMLYRYYQKTDDQKMLEAALSWIEYLEKLIPSSESHLLKASIYNKLEDHIAAKKCVVSAKEESDYNLKAMKYQGIIDNYK